MKRAYFLPVLALLGACLAIVVVLRDNRPASIESPLVVVPEIPYTAYLAGAGIVEASTGNIAIGTPVAGIVMDIFVKVGDQVNPGAPLFRIDDRDLQGQLLTGLVEIKQAEASLRKPRHQLDYAQDLKQNDASAISAREMSVLKDDMSLAEAALDLARARVAQIRLAIERHTVHAAMAGEVLQLKMRLGEFVEGANSPVPLLLLGGNERWNLRVDIDEYDAWRFQPQSDAVAYVRGYPRQKIPLRFEYTEPYIIPKTALTGQATERTDTRVLQVLYSFARDDQQVYVGQQLDVFIRAVATKDRQLEKDG